MTLSSSSIFNSYDNENGVSRNCITNIIRRILCISNLPTTCPFDRIKEEAKDHSLECGSATPGLVARLMGLNSLPPFDLKQSPSTNHVDSNRNSRSPRTRKILIPTYREFEDENFFILSFDRGGEKNLEFTAERWKSSSSSGKKQKRRRRRELNKESLHRISVYERELDCETKSTEIRKKDSGNGLRSSQNSKGAGEKQRKAKRQDSKVDELKTERDSENSSPNSVLDFLEFPPDKEAANPGDESRLENSKLRRTLLAVELGNIIINSNDEGMLIKASSCVEEEKKHKRLRDSKKSYAENWDEATKLAAKELLESSWLNNETLKNHHLKVIGRELAFEIFDQLLLELLLIQ